MLSGAEIRRLIEKG
ncbi:MAG: hypothetical protein QXJ59_11400, partial [Thermofilaceae archaeon]